MGEVVQLTVPPAPPVRSMLFVPGLRTDLVGKAAASGADAVVIDLEDAVASSRKADARAQVRDLLESDLGDLPLLVRINGLQSEAALDDLEAVVSQRLTGVMLPKCESARDVQVVCQVLTWLEGRAGLTPGHTRVLPVLETATGVRSAYEIVSSSPRCAYAGGLGVRGGDVERSLGYRWSSSGRETVVMRSSTLIDVRAAGTPNPLTGLWADIGDIAGLEAFAAESRDLGYEGMLCIHPSHVEAINRAFSPSTEELDRDRRLVETMREAQTGGHGVIQFEGVMVDEAMLTTAQRRLARWGA